MQHQPMIVGIGGTTTPGSSTEQALAIAVAAAEKKGARVRIFDGASLAALPHFSPTSSDCDVACAFVDALRQADGLIIASPGYHGSISGLVKNAIDYIEGMAKDGRVYLDGMPVGMIATAYGWQATGSTLAAMRSIVHALRGWPTPLGAGINTSGGIFSGGTCLDEPSERQLETVGRQVVEFALMKAGTSRPEAVAAIRAT